MRKLIFAAAVCLVLRPARRLNRARALLQVSLLVRLLEAQLVPLSAALLGPP